MSSIYVSIQDYLSYLPINLYKYMNTLTKWLIIGLATISVSWIALLGTGMYAASTGKTVNTHNQNSKMEMRGGMRGENMINSLSGKVSIEALTALQALMNKHKAEMDTMQSNGVQPTQVEIKTKMETYKAEMNALYTKYPELKTTMAGLPQGRKDGKHGIGQQDEMNALLAGVSDADKTAIENIRTEYRGKMDALRTEEKTKLDGIIAKYPEIKTKLDALEKNRPRMGQWNGIHTSLRHQGK